MHLAIVLQDLRHGWRQMRRAPALNASVVVVLALGVGVNAIAFSFFNGLLFRAHVSRDPASFVRLYAERSGDERPQSRGVPTMMTGQEMQALRMQSRTLSAVTASKWATFAVDAPIAANLRGLFVSCNFLAVHTRPVIVGRNFQESDCTAPGGAAVAVLSERAWTAYFNREPRTVGRNLRVNNQALTVIGIVPDDAIGDPIAQMMFVPFTLQPLLYGPDDYLRAPPHREAWLNVSGRLAPGQTARAAEAEIRGILAGLDRLHPGRRTAAVVTNGALINEPGRAGVIVSLVFAATALLLLLVCSNVATLLLSRAEGRRSEIALRRTLGADRARLITQFAIEGTVPALVAAAGALSLAWYIPDRVAPMLAGLPLGVSLVPDWRVFSLTLAIALLAGAGAALVPAMPVLSAKADSRIRTRDHLMAQQLAVSLALLVALGLVWNEQRRLRHPSLAFDAERVLVTNIDVSRLGYSAARAAATYSELLTRVEAMPGVQELAVSTHPPFRGLPPLPVLVDAGRGRRVEASVRGVSPGYFGCLALRSWVGGCSRNRKRNHRRLPRCRWLSRRRSRAR
jgi:predicted permease